MNREKGVKSTSCTSCGATLEYSVMADGAVAAGPCQTCYPTTQKAAQQPEETLETPQGPGRTFGSVTVTPIDPAGDEDVDE